jgi:hypothetical protein
LGKREAEFGILGVEVEKLIKSARYTAEKLNCQLTSEE